MPGTAYNTAVDHHQIEITVVIDRVAVCVEDGGVPIPQGLVPLPAPVRQPDVAAAEFEVLKGELEGKPYTSAIVAILEGRVETVVAQAGFVDVLATTIVISFTLISKCWWLSRALAVCVGSCAKQGIK